MKTKEINESCMKDFIERSYIKDFIEKLVGKPYEEIDSYEIAKSEPYKKIDRDEKIEIAKWLQKKYEEYGEVDDLLFNAAITIGLVGEEPQP